MTRCGHVGDLRCMEGREAGQRPDFTGKVQMRGIAHALDRDDVGQPGVGGDVAANHIEKTMPVQDLREFTFTVSSRLQPERLLQDFDATGLRLNSVSITMSPQGQFDYTMKGSIYAQN